MLHRPADLGRPIPDSPHAVSVCLPTWADNVGYEEGEPRVIETIDTGYPRFVYNRFCRELFDQAAERVARPGERCVVFPGQAEASRAQGFLFDHAQTRETRLAALPEWGVFAAVFPEQHARVAQSAWQHRGEGISSRQAEDLLAGREAPDGSTAVETIRRRVASLAGVDGESVWLASCGMSGFAAVHRALDGRSPGRDSLQFGFPYVDSLKIQELCGSAGSMLFPAGGDEDLEALEKVLSGDLEYFGVFTEFPSNPLLAVPNLRRLAEVCRRFEIPLVVDETISGFGNVDVLPVADAIVSSLTKSFSGVGDVTGGSVIVNPNGPFAAELTSRLLADPPTGLYAADAIVLEANSRDYADRFPRINASTRTLVRFLREQPGVASVYYPDGQYAEDYDAFRRPDGGRSGLFSILLHNPAETTAAFFDALALDKGPNLGTNYTLVCPFTILAHYRELDFVESCGVSRYLVRVSVGLEPVEQLTAAFAAALG